MLRISYTNYEALRAHGEETYPHECCGALLGHSTPDGNQVLQIVRAGNTRTDRAHDRYNIAPEELIKIQRQARGLGLNTGGSHPRIRTVRRNGRRRILTRPTGLAVPTSLPAWTRARRQSLIRSC